MGSESRNNEGADSLPFDEIVDDGAPRNDCIAWAVSELDRGQTPEDVAAELVANGWSMDDAESISDAARQSSHRIKPRQSVARAYGAGDPNVMRAATPLAPMTLLGAAGGLFRAALRFWSTKDIGRSHLSRRKRRNSVMSWLSLTCFVPIVLLLSVAHLTHDRSYIDNYSAIFLLCLPGSIFGLIGTIKSSGRSPIGWIGLLLNGLFLTYFLYVIITP
jgi:hypothetical protein